MTCIEVDKDRYYNFFLGSILFLIYFLIRLFINIFYYKLFDVFDGLLYLALIVGLSF